MSDQADLISSELRLMQADGLSFDTESAKETKLSEKLVLGHCWYKASILGVRPPDAIHAFYILYMLLPIIH